MALFIFYGSTAMSSRDKQVKEPQQGHEPVRRMEWQSADAARRARTVTHVVDPYDMRVEAQPEEPGYGHGV